MVQIVSVAVAVLGLLFGVVKEYQSGNIRIPQIAQTSQNEQIAQTPHPLQFCLMCYDPNTNIVWYQYESGEWHTTPPAQKKIGVYY